MQEMYEYEQEVEVEEEEEGKEDISKKVIMTRTCSLQTHPECEKWEEKRNQKK